MEGRIAPEPGNRSRVVTRDPSTDAGCVQRLVGIHGGGGSARCFWLRRTPCGSRVKPGMTGLGRARGDRLLGALGEARDYRPGQCDTRSSVDDDQGGAFRANFCVDRPWCGEGLDALAVDPYDACIL